MSVPMRRTVYEGTAVVILTNDRPSIRYRKACSCIATATMGALVFREIPCGSEISVQLEYYPGPVCTACQVPWICESPGGSPMNSA